MRCSSAISRVKRIKIFFNILVIWANFEQNIELLVINLSNSKIASTRRSNVTLLRRVDVIFPNSKFRITTKFKISPKKSNFVTKKFFLSQILWVLGQSLAIGNLGFSSGLYENDPEKMRTLIIRFSKFSQTNFRVKTENFIGNSIFLWVWGTSSCHSLCATGMHRPALTNVWGYDN